MSTPTNPWEGRPIPGHTDHAAERALERFGITLSPSDFLRLLLYIKRGDAPFLGTDAGTKCDHYLVQLPPDNFDARAVYNPETQTIVTLMPVDFGRYRLDPTGVEALKEQKRLRPPRLYRRKRRRT